jgi:hypothetical protein
MDYAIFFAEFESVDIGMKESESAPADNDNDVNAFFDAFDAFFTSYNIFQQFFTTCGPINGQITTILLDNAAAAHGITGIDLFEERKPRKESHLFVFYSRYDGNIFQGIMPDTGAAGISTAGEPQVRALQLKFPNVTMNSSTAGHKVKFGNNPESTFFGTIAVETPFGTIRFAVMPINTPFLLYLANMNRCGIYFNNINNTLMHNGKKHPIVRKWEHPWFLLGNAETTAVHCHLTETELRQLHQRFGHPAAERFCRVLARAGYENVNESVMVKIGKYCHQCQMHGSTPGRFRFTIRNDVNFNYRLVVDVMYINGKLVLYAINEAILFQVARFLANMQARTTWNIFKAMWIDTYVGPPDIMVTDAGKNFKSSEFVANARILVIEIEEVPIEAHNSIGNIERYHGPLKRAFEVITADLGTSLAPEYVLQIAVKAVNNTAGHDNLIPTFLMFETYPRLSPLSPSLPSLIIRANAVRKAMAEIRKLKARR